MVVDAFENRIVDIKRISADLLLIVAIKDAGVLSAPVIALFVERRWIVEHEKMANKLLVGLLVTIEFAVVYLDVSRCAGANFSV